MMKVRWEMTRAYTDGDIFPRARFSRTLRTGRPAETNARECGGLVGSRVSGISPLRPAVRSLLALPLPWPLLPHPRRDTRTVLYRPIDVRGVTALDVTIRNNACAAVIRNSVAFFCLPRAAALSLSLYVAVFFCSLFLAPCACLGSKKSSVVGRTRIRSQIKLYMYTSTHGAFDLEIIEFSTTKFKILTSRWNPIFSFIFVIQQYPVFFSCEMNVEQKMWNVF